MLEVNGLTRRFGGLIAVNNVDFRIEPYQMAGIIGPNGAGKTVLFNLITGYLKPDSGSVIFQGEDITKLKTHERIRKGISRTFQIPRPFSRLTVFQNVYSASITMTERHENPERETKKILELTGLSEQQDKLAKDLSTGDLKLLEISRALATKPRLLLLDEPFAGVSADVMTGLSSLIRQLHEDELTVVIVEHILKELMKLVRRVIVLNEGVKISDGTPEEVGDDKKVIEAYLGSARIA